MVDKVEFGSLSRGFRFMRGISNGRGTVGSGTRAVWHIVVPLEKLRLSDPLQKEEPPKLDGRSLRGLKVGMTVVRFDDEATGDAAGREDGSANVEMNGRWALGLASMTGEASDESPSGWRIDMVLVFKAASSRLRHQYEPHHIKKDDAL